VAVDRGLQLDLADALERADEESFDGDQAACVRGLDVALPNSDENRSSSRVCSSVSSMVPSAVVFSSRSRSSCLVSRALPDVAEAAGGDL